MKKEHTDPNEMRKRRAGVALRAYMKEVGVDEPGDSSSISLPIFVTGAMGVH